MCVHRDFDLKLWTNGDVFAPGVVFEHVREDGPQPIPYDMGTFYKGQVIGKCACVCVCTCVCVCAAYVLRVCMVVSLLCGLGMYHVGEVQGGYAIFIDYILPCAHHTR